MDEILRPKKLAVVVNFIQILSGIHNYGSCFKLHSLLGPRILRSLRDFGKIGRPLSDAHVSQLIKVGTEDENLYFP
jgi:hypothetical protein